MAEFRSERADLWLERADWRLEKVDLKSERADIRPERADFMLERPNLGLYILPDFMPGFPLLKFTIMQSREWDILPLGSFFVP